MALAPLGPYTFAISSALLLKALAKGPAGRSELAAGLRPAEWKKDSIFPPRFRCSLRLLRYSSYTTSIVREYIILPFGSIETSRLLSRLLVTLVDESLKSRLPKQTSLLWLLSLI